MWVNEEWEHDKFQRLHLYLEKGRVCCHPFVFIWVQRGLKPRQKLEYLLNNSHPLCFLIPTCHHRMVERGKLPS